VIARSIFLGTKAHSPPMTGHPQELVRGLGSPRILVVGDLLLDRYVFGAAERISPEAPIPILLATGQEDRLGGAASVAAMLIRLEADAILAGVVGDDESGRILRRCLDELGLAGEHVRTDPSRPTTLKQRYVARAQNRHPQQILRVDVEARTALASLVEEELLEGLEACWARCDIVLVSDYGKGVCTPGLLRHIFERAGRHGRRVIVDPARGGDYSRYSGCSCLTPNRLETALATGRIVENASQALDAGEQLRRQLDLDAVVVTLDHEGMALCHRDGWSQVFPTRERQVYDVTGAGDMVLSVIGLSLAAGGDYPEAITLANAAAGLEVERLGVVTVSRAELAAELGALPLPSPRKQLSVAELLAELDRRRQRGQRVVFTNGCFDILHAGHVHCLQQARALGDFLVVGLNSDASVCRLKGQGRPLHHSAERASVLAALACVDAVTVFDDDSPLRLIEAVRPDLLVKGADYRQDQVIGREFVEAAGGSLVLIPLVEGLSSTRLRPHVG
jgi:D-beta-D-heptose 7-phosphate kinase/D-beta-D-heptose 1-phosphate adenosyltransferase